MPMRHRQTPGVELHPQGGFHVPTVTAGHGDDHGDAALPSPIEYPSVTGFHAIVSETQAPQTVAFVGVGTRQENQEMGRETVVQMLQRLLQRLDVGRVITAIRQLDVEVAGLLAEREVFFPVQRQGEDRWIIPKDVSRSIALMHVQIHNGNAQRLGSLGLPLAHPFGLHEPGGDRCIVEHAETTALVGVSMMGTPGQIASNTLAIQRGSTRLEGGAHRSSGALCHGRAPWKTDLALFSRGQATFGDSCDVGRGVHQRQLTVCGGLGLCEADDRQMRLKSFAQSRIFDHRKTMALGQWQHKMVGVEGMHPRIVPTLSMAGMVVVFLIDPLCCSAQKKLAFFWQTFIIDCVALQHRLIHLL